MTTDRDCLMAARIFGDASNILFEISQEGAKVKSDDMVSQGITAIFLLSFTIELRLKAFIFKRSGTAVKGHNLAVLFDDLEANQKQRIVELSSSKLGISQYDFYEELGKVKFSFQEWRYFFEEARNINIKFLHVFDESIRVVFNEAH